MAYKTEDADLAFTLRDQYPEVFAEVADMVVRADTHEKFQELLEDLYK
jgi:hypothetical protein